MSPPDALEQIAARYREEGYQVSIRPSAADLPSFLENSEVLLYAHKGSEHLALGRRSLVAGAATLDASAVFAAKDSDVTYLRTLLSEAEGFLRMGAVDAALLLGWAVTEAALREAARSNGADLQRETPRKLMEAAGASKTLSSEEQVTLELCLNLRNVIIHGFRPSVLPPDTVSDLLGSARRLVSLKPAEGKGAGEMPGQDFPAGVDEGMVGRFRELAEQWRTETAHLSNLRKKALHPAYQQIIGMGEPAVALILAEMKRKPGQWFWALHAITGADPVSEDSRGKLPEMTEAWLQWGRQQGHRI